MADAGKILLAFGRAHERVKADFEAAATSGDTARRDDAVRALDALTELMGQGAVLTIIAKEIERQ